MQNTDNTITGIANLLGYTDPSHFARAFRRIAGVSPREYLPQCARVNLKEKGPDTLLPGHLKDLFSNRTTAARLKARIEILHYTV